VPAVAFSISSSALAAGIRERIEITKEEQARFEEKREDLRNLIRKMWEEEVT
jgi:hypothetical protein